ncbi:MAG: hypothetical protein Kow00102_12180 [Spirochaetota bacterium]
MCRGGFHIRPNPLLAGCFDKRYVYQLNVLSNLSSVIMISSQQPVSEGTQCIEDQSPISGAVFGLLGL